MRTSASCAAADAPTDERERKGDPRQRCARAAAIGEDLDARCRARDGDQGQKARSEEGLVVVVLFVTADDRTALEYIPASIKLWKETVKLEENPEDARILLARAVEVIPHSQELWLALARLETPSAAESVLNKARKMIPTSHEIWIAAGRLSEQQGKGSDMVDLVMAKGVAALKKNGAELSRESWLAEAEKAESQGSLFTSQAIIKATLHLDVEEEDRMDVWLEDAVSMEVKGHVSAARAIYTYCLRVFPMKQAIWRRAAELEKVHGTKCVPRFAGVC